MVKRIIILTIDSSTLYLLKSDVMTPHLRKAFPYHQPRNGRSSGYSLVIGTRSRRRLRCLLPHWVLRSTSHSAWLIPSRCLGERRCLLAYGNAWIEISLESLPCGINPQQFLYSFDCPRAMLLSKTCHPRPVSSKNFYVVPTCLKCMQTRDSRFSLCNEWSC